MNFAVWCTKLEELVPNYRIEEENGEIVIRTGLVVQATFDGTTSIPTDQLEIVQAEAVG